MKLMMKFEANEESLIEAAQLGCRQSMGVLIERYQRAVKIFIISRVNNSEDALDLAQDVFVTAFVKFEDFDKIRSLDAWFKGIAKNKILNYWKKSRAIPMGDIEALEALVDKNRGFDTPPDSEESLLEALKSCIAKLNSTDSNLIQDRYMREQSIDSLASKFDLNYSALTMRLHRIRKQLQSCITLHSDSHS